MKKTFLEGALILVEMDGNEFSSPINTDIVKKYYTWGNKKSNLLELKTQKSGSGE